MLHSLQPLSEEETERFTILYRIWVRIFFSDYVSEVKEVEPPKKTHIKGVYVSLVDLIAFKKAIKMDELRDRFYDVDAIIAELKAGYLLEQDAKEYKLNPYFLDSVMPVIDRILKELNEEREQKGQREGKDILICHNCKKIVESMYQELRLKKITCSACHSTDIRKPEVNLEDVKKCDNLIKKIERFLAEKDAIETEIRRNRENLEKREKEIIEEKVAKSSLELLLEHIPTKKMISDSEEKDMVTFYNDRYKPTDHLVEKLKVECSWMKKLQLIKNKRK